MKASFFWAAAVLLPTFLLTETRAETAYRVPSDLINSGAYRYSGILWNEAGQGSGTVVRHPKIVASAAHVIWNDDAFSRSSAWLGTNWFLARHHADADPGTTGQARLLRGFWNFSRYGGTSSERDFHRDLLVHYAYGDLAGGGHAGWWTANSTTTHPLNRNLPKLLVGYSGADSHFMNRTGPFTSRFRSSYGYHFWNRFVGVYGGMSGGGAFVHHAAWGEDLLAGVIVSGNPEDGSLGTGVRALDSAASRLMTRAIQSAERTTVTTSTFNFGTAVPIPDRTRTWTVVNLPVSGLPERVEEVLVSLSITHPWVQDLEVVLRSPSRRTRTLHRRHGTGYEDLLLEDVSVSSSYRGTAANGTWQLLVRDLAAEDFGQLESFSLTISGRSAAER